MTGSWVTLTANITKEQIGLGRGVKPKKNPNFSDFIVGLGFLSFLSFLQKLYRKGFSADSCLKTLT